MNEAVRGWIGVDLDGTLAHYDSWKGVDHIGAPIPAMVVRVQRWLSEGKDVRIMTARVYPGPDRSAAVARYHIGRWCLKHLGVLLPITHEKDFAMIELWDDRCKQVVPNTGISVEEELQRLYAQLEGNQCRAS